MRRKDREVTDLNEIGSILTNAKVLRIAMNDGKAPYIVPVNFCFELEGEQLTLYFHGAAQGKKHDLIAKDPYVGFETDTGSLIPPSGGVACTASYAYESVIGTGVAEIAEEDEKPRILSLLMHHYGIDNTNFSPAQIQAVTVYRIIAETYSAKRRPM